MRLEEGHAGQFDVFLGDEKIASRGGGLLQRLMGGGWPEADAVIAAIRGRMGS